MGLLKTFFLFECPIMLIFAAEFVKILEKNARFACASRDLVLKRRLMLATKVLR